MLIKYVSASVYWQWTELCDTLAYTRHIDKNLQIDFPPPPRKVWKGWIAYELSQSQASFYQASSLVFLNIISLSNLVSDGLLNKLGMSLSNLVSF